MKWQARAEDFLKQSVKDLWNNSEALSFLHGRGLQDETIRAACLGWNSMDRYEGREAWGLDPLKDERGKDKTVWLPSGLVIPLVDSISEDLHAVTRLRIRKPEGEPRYVIVSGSYTGPITWGMNKKVLCIVESELDGLLIEQEAGHLCGVIALGNAQAKPDRETHEALNQADLILISLDFDEAGAGASWKFWLTTYPNARRWPVPVGKDPGEAFQKGLSIRTWVEAGLRTETLSEGNEGPAEAEIRPFLRDWLDKYDDASLERLAIMTIDGRLSDGEAVQALFS